MLPRLTAPTLVLHDTGFPFGSIEEREELAAAIPGARFVVIPGDVDAEIAAIDSFLRSSRGAETKSQTAGQATHVHGTSPLTPRELEVLRLVATGMRNREISEQLVLSERTVSRHLTNVYQKLNLRNRAEATAFAIRENLS